MRGESSAVRQRYHHNLGLVLGYETLRPIRDCLRFDHHTHLSFTHEREPFALFEQQGKMYDVDIWPEPGDGLNLVRNRELIITVAGTVLASFTKPALYGMLGSLTAFVLLEANCEAQGKSIERATVPQLDAIADTYAVTELEIDIAPFRVSTFALAQQRYRQLHGPDVLPFPLHAAMREYLSHLGKQLPYKAAEIRGKIAELP